MTLSRSTCRSLGLAMLFSVGLLSPAMADAVTFNADIPDFGTVELKVMTARAPAQPVPPGPMEVRAIGHAARLMQDWSRPGMEGAALMAAHYDSHVLFYGSTISHAAVMRDRYDFASRWPLRHYRVDPASLRVSCARDCRITAEYDFDATNPATRARSSGRSSLDLTLRPMGDSFVIAAENGAVLYRH